LGGAPDPEQGHPGGPGPRRGPSGARSHPTQVTPRVGCDAGQARRLLLEGSGTVRAVHRGGRQRRRQRQAGTRLELPGDPPHPPLDRAAIAKEHYYLKDEAVLRDFDAAHEGRKYEVLRFKGLGEMDWEELKVTTMDRATRNLLQVSVEDAAIADDIFSKLMGDDAETRRHFIQENAKDVRFLDI